MARKRRFTRSRARTKSRSRKRSYSRRKFKRTRSASRRRRGMGVSMYKRPQAEVKRFILSGYTIETILANYPGRNFASHLWFPLHPVFFNKNNKFDDAVNTALDNGVNASVTGHIGDKINLISTRFRMTISNYSNDSTCNLIRFNLM